MVAAVCAAWLAGVTEPAARESADDPKPISIELGAYEKGQRIEYVVVLDSNPLGIISRTSTWGHWVTDTPLLRSIVTQSDLDDLIAAHERTRPPFREVEVGSPPMSVEMKIGIIFEEGMMAISRGYSASEAKEALDAMMACSHGTTYDALAKLRTRILSGKP